MKAGGPPADRSKDSGAVRGASSENRQESPGIRNGWRCGRAVILGAPGGGKTFLTQSTAMAVARQGLEELRAHTRPVDKLPLPVWLELDTLGQDSRPVDLLDALVAMFREQSVRRHDWCVWLRRKLPDLSCWLILDALDQVKAGNQARLGSRLHLDTLGWQCRVLLTCRTGNYDRGCVPWVQVTEYNLAPLQWAETGQLITGWYGRGDPRGQKLNAVVQHSYSLQQACRTPALTRCQKEIRIVS